MCIKTWEIRPFFLEFSSAILLRSSFSRLCWPYFAWLLDTSELIHWLAFVWYYKNNLTCGISAVDNFYHFTWWSNFNVFCICWRIVYFWLSCRLSDASSADQPRKTCGPSRRNLFRSMIQVQLISLRLRRPRAARFIKSGTCKQISRAIKKIFIFPPKNLQKIRVHCCFLLILWVKSLQICWIFPPKDLGKIRRPKYACANFLKIW